MYRYRVLDLLELCHHILIDMETSRRIQDHQIVSIFLCMLQRSLCDIRRLVVLSHGENFHALLLSVDLQLFDGRRTVHVTGYQQWLFALQLVFPGKLCRGRGLTCSLKTCHHDHRNGASRLQCDLCRLRSHQTDQFFVDDLDHHLPRIQSVHHVLSDGPLLDAPYKVLDHLKVDVSRQKSSLDLL